ncbi:unnamed protein product, partial [Darwinula stevensoni]
TTETASTLKPEYAIVIHGGAGTIEKKDMDAATEKLYLDALNEALNIGETILKNANCGLEIVDPSYFHTEKRWNSLQKILKEDEQKTELSEDEKGNKKHGTVGCVALDKAGNIVAGTSTGGMTNKRFNRLGDAPIIGAGTYADNNTCGVSCTGHGEYFIRYTVARDIAALMEYKGVSLKEACQYIIYEKLVQKGGEGGLVAIDKDGNIEMPFNSSGMYRGFAKDGKREVKIYKD